MRVLIEAVNTPTIYKFDGLAATLRIEAIRGFTTSNGQVIPPGNGREQDFYLEVPITVVDEEMLIPSFEIDSTEDAYPWDSEITGDIPGYRATIVLANGRKIPYLPQFKVPTLIEGDPSLTWSEIRIFNRAFRRRFTGLDRMINVNQAQEWIQTAVGELNRASATNTGVTALTVDPTDPMFPLAVSDTDPRVPTEDENDALAGTDGTPGDLNRFVTDSDPRLLSPRIVYASRVAVLDSNIETGGGTDDTAALQAILDTATAANPLELVMDGVALIAGLNVRGHTTISAMNGGGFYLKNGGSRAALRNLNRTSGTIVNKNITLKDFTLNGNYANQAKFEAGGAIIGGQFEFGTIFNCAIQMFGVSNLKIQGIKVIDSKNWPIHLANWDGVSVLDTWLVNSEAVQDNHDGIHVNGPGVNLTINNIRLTGQTDDGIAINADDGTASSIVSMAPISDVSISNVFLDNCLFGVRVISNGQRVDRISISNVYGIVKQDGYILHIDDLSYYFGSGTADIGRVSLDGVSVTVLPTGAPGPWSEAVRVEAQIEELSVTNFKQGADWYPDYRPIIRVLNSSATQGFGNVKVLTADFEVYDPPGTDTLPSPAGYAAPRLSVYGNVENLIYHINHYRDPTCAQGYGAFLIQTGDITKGVANMQFSGVLTRQANTLVLESGKFTNLRINGLIDLDNGGVTLLVNTPGATVATPRVSADGVSLNGGTFLGGGGTAAVCTQASGWAVSFDGVTAKGIPLITGATPSVRGMEQVRTNNGGATTITNFTLGYPGQKLVVIMGDANTTIQNGANIITRSGADITPANGKTYSFISDAADVWRQLN